jgi:threonine dehydrogenase-like Zn-dependent dehydrogenase
VISIEEHADPEARIALIHEATDGRGADVVFEFSGAPGAFAEGLQMVAPNGRYGIVGTVGGPAQSVIAHHITNRGLTVYGSFGGDIDSYWKALEFMRQHRGRFDWELILGTRYSLDGLTTALERMRDFEEIKPVFAPAGG